MYIRVRFLGARSLWRSTHVIPRPSFHESPSPAPLFATVSPLQIPPAVPNGFDGVEGRGKGIGSQAGDASWSVDRVNRTVCSAWRKDVHSRFRLQRKGKGGCHRMSTCVPPPVYARRNGIVAVEMALRVFILSVYPVLAPLPKRLSSNMYSIVATPHLWSSNTAKGSWRFCTKGVTCYVAARVRTVIRCSR